MSSSSQLRQIRFPLPFQAGIWVDRLMEPGPGWSNLCSQPGTVGLAPASSLANGLWPLKSLGRYLQGAPGRARGVFQTAGRCHVGNEWETHSSTQSREVLARQKRLHFAEKKIELNILFTSPVITKRKQMIIF